MSTNALTILHKDASYPQPLEVFYITGIIVKRY